MFNSISTDAPISSISQDVFGRSHFAKLIASLCGSHTSQSTVIGVYGKWGDGKTSVLNMVSESISPEIFQIKFNPWFFKDEEELLQAFFKLLAEKLGNKLSTRKEDINKIVADYGETLGILDIIPIPGIAAIRKGAIKLFKAPKTLSAQTAKKRINSFIEKSSLNLVIFIDDIDRLDSREVATIFKLVKLLGDFPRTTYILSFDIDIVAHMLAPHYGGLPESGYHFLEKVIQLPLPIPKAHEDDLLHFVQDALDAVAKQNSIDLEQYKDRFVEILADGFLEILNNPRKVIRFSNSLRFSLTILKGEVNIMDLFVVESFKASLPEFYSFIRDNKAMFLEDYHDEKMNQYQDNRKKVSLEANSVINFRPVKLQQAIRQLTMQLFTRFVWVDSAEAKEEKAETLLINKRICSPDYFERYFTFALKEQEIPDVHFAQYYIENTDASIDEISTQLVKDFEKYSLSKIAFKLAMNRAVIKGTHAEKLTLALCLVSDHFKEVEGFDLGSPFKMLSFSISTMIESIQADKVFQVALEAVQSAKSLIFAAELTARFIMPTSKEDNDILFKGNQAIEIKNTYIARLYLLVRQMGFFNAIAEQYMVRQIMWWNDVQPASLEEQIAISFKNDDNAALKLLRIFTPTLHVSSTDSKKQSIIKADFYEDEYYRLDLIVGADKMFKELMKKFGDLSEISSVFSTGYRDALDDKTLIGKFQRMYKMKKVGELFPGKWELEYAGKYNGKEEFEIREGNKYFAKTMTDNFFKHYFNIESVSINNIENKIHFTKVALLPQHRSIENEVTIIELGRRYEGEEESGAVTVKYKRID